VVDRGNSDKRAKEIEKSKELVNLAREKTDVELFIFTNEKRNEYTPAYIIAAEMELEKRRSDKK
jgi:hypothetical protein